MGNNLLRPNKGKSLLELPENYTLIDLETTGLDSTFDRIIEVAAIKIRNNTIVDKFQSLVNPKMHIYEFITELTGINDEMVKDAPVLADVLPDFFNFIGDDIVIGHNVNFDIHFIYDKSEILLNKSFSNDFVDTMRLARWSLRDLEHHRLIDIVEHFNIPQTGSHRALSDCETTFECYKCLCAVINEIGIDECFKSRRKRVPSYNDRFEELQSNVEADETHPLYQKICVFTGKLEKMTRMEAAQLVTNIGGICSDELTKKTNFLILGNNDYCSNIKDGKSSKQKKAEKYKLKGCDIEILSESVFYDLLME